jgi:outer membrane protein OmpA-like peptidoglycan-associated protein
MAKCRPAKWVPWALLGAGLPLLAAYVTGTASLTDDIKSRTGQLLSANEQTAWAKVDNNVRDYQLSGTAPSQEALDLAVKTVAGTYGVRTVSNTIQIVEPVKMLAPTVESVNVTTATPEIKGTWHEGVADTLTVKVGETAYKLNENPELTSVGGNWLLRLTQPLAEGNYDITVESSDGKVSMASDAPGKLVVDLPDPVVLPAPTVENYVGNMATPTFTGTWPEVAAKAVDKNLQVKIGEDLFVLGKNPELSSNGFGNWRLTPSKPLAEGSFTVMPGIVGADGKWQKAEAPAQVVIDVTPPAVPEVAAPAAGAKWPFAIIGKWQDVAGNTLTAALAGVTYAANKETALKVDGKGGFSFDPKVELAPGSYDVDISVKDVAGNIVHQTLAAAVVIPEPPKIEPKVEKVEVPVVPAMAPVTDAVSGSAIWPYAITGTWDDKPGNTLSASVGGHNYKLGTGAALTSPAPGKFSFAPAAKFAPGSYDVELKTTNAAGEATVATAKAAIVIPEPAVVAPVVPLMAAVPAIVPADAKWPYTITGTWDEKPGNTLTATVAGRHYALNRGAALTSDGAGKYSFAPSAKFAPGSYDVDITTTNAAGESKTTKAIAAIVIPEPVVVVPVLPVKAATVMAAPAGAVWPYAISGTWDERPGNSLTATVNGRSYVLGRGAALTSDGAGKFSFAPSAKFAPGNYDVDFTTTDASGAKLVTTMTAAIVIPKPEGVIPPPPPAVEIPSPTVFSQLDLTGAPIIKGTWPDTMANNLNVTLGGITYKLGVDGNLNAKGGDWTLLPGVALKDGTYDVVVEATDAAGNMGMDVTTNELEVDATQPLAPTVMAAAADSSPDHLSGTWDEAGAKGLKVTIPQINLTAELGAAGSALTSDGAGNWRLKLAAPLPAGKYNVIAETTDSRGRIQTDASEAEVVVLAKGETPPPPPPPYDCVAVMTRIANVFPIRFDYDLTEITKPFDVSVSQYAALLKDPRCTSINVEIDGHADFRGSEIYNMGLSERRAEVIMGMFEKAGVDKARMSIKGYGKSRPLDAALTDEARAKNRRVEISVRP